jgi:Mg-chelatase subunit ChlD
MSDKETWLEELTVQFDPVGSWGFVALITLALAAVLLAVPPDRTRLSRGRRLGLVALRLAAFLALVGCMLRPTLVSSRKARQQATVIVLVDASESMTVADVAGGRTRWEALTGAVEAARPAAAELVARGDVEIAAWTFDRELHPLAARGEDPFPLGAWRDGETADETALGSAVDEALRTIGSKRLAGLIVLSDGAQHAYAPRDLPPQTAARNVADAGAPIWSVTFGQQRGGGQGRDAAVVNLSVAETVYLENMLEVSGRVRLEGLAGRSVAVVLLAEDGKGGMEEVARTTVQTAAEAGEESVRLAWTPKALGERKLTLQVEPQDGEVVLTNNQLSTFVTVIDGGLKVLYLEGALRVEQRFLRRVLAASPDMQVDFRWISSIRRDRWPVDLARDLAGEHDVYLIGDLDAAAVRPADLETIRDRVNQGAGIGLLGGFHAFEAGGWASSALGPLVPFEPDRLARQPFDEPVREGLHLRGPLTMLPDPRFGGISILRLGETGDDARTAWEKLPPLAGANRLGRLTATAKPLAVTADGQPLLVAREYGAGRVLAFAADSTWRWAMQGAAEEHRRFWRQLVLWLARKDDAEADSLWLRLSQRRISPGSPLEFDAGITGPEGRPRADVPLEAVVISPSGQSRPVRVVPAGETFAGTVTGSDEPGDWTLVVRGRPPGAAVPLERSARFTVFRQDLELANPRANPLLMRQLAEATSGGVRLPEELPGIFAEIAARPAEYESREQWSFTPWDTWPMLLLLAGCLTAEWYLRKKWGLV